MCPADTIIGIVPEVTVNTLSGCTQAHVFAPWLLHQVLLFIAHIYTMQYVELRGYCPV